MNIPNEPLVSVITPVYNGEEFLAECIESVLGQTYQNYEYIIVNNCSTDKSLEIAMQYAKQDSRIRVHSNERFLPVIDNHNHAFRLMSVDAKYCKVVSADDCIFKDCLTRMVEVAEGNPDVGIISSYQLSGSIVRWQGFEYPRTVFSGREVCRKNLLGSDKEFGFGSPTSMMYRADIVRASDSYFPSDSPHSDTSACFKHLYGRSFGFVYAVLSYERIHPNTVGTKAKKLDIWLPTYLSDLIKYGPLYMNEGETKREITNCVNVYFRRLALARLVGLRGKEYWQYHTEKLRELGYPFTVRAFLKGIFSAFVRLIISPIQSLTMLRRNSLRT